MSSQNTLECMYKTENFIGQEGWVHSKKYPKYILGESTCEWHYIFFSNSLHVVLPCTKVLSTNLPQWEFKILPARSGDLDSHCGWLLERTFVHDSYCKIYTVEVQPNLLGV